MIIGTSISEAYIDMLKNTLRKSAFMQVTSVRLSEDSLKSDSVKSAFENYVFPDGRSGRWWIEDRLKAVFDSKGEYWEPIHRDHQFDYVVSALRGMANGSVPRWNANRLIITLFSPSNLHIARAPTPPCLINLCFYPIRQTLSLIGTFRAQYTDAKAYGNLLSLAMLLKDVAEKTGFTPFKLYSVAQKAILKYPKSTAKDLFNKLLVAFHKNPS